MFFQEKEHFRQISLLLELINRRSISVFMIWNLFGICFKPTLLSTLNAVRKGWWF
jgi:hypothetical protein